MEQTQQNGTQVTVERGLLDQLIEATRRVHKPALTFQDKLTLAQNMAKAKVFPSIENEYQALAAIEIGESFGMDPGVALMNIDFGAQGKPSISVHWQAGQMQSRGWRWEFLAHTGETCHMRFHPPRGRNLDPFEMQFTMTQARAIGVYDKMQNGGKGGANLGSKWNYKSWADDMLYAFILRRVVRRHEPSILGGFAGTEDEDAEMGLQMGVYEGPPTTAESGQQASDDLFPDRPTPETRRVTVNLDGEDVDPATGEVLERPPQEPTAASGNPDPSPDSGQTSSPEGAVDDTPSEFELNLISVASEHGFEPEQIKALACVHYGLATFDQLGAAQQKVVMDRFDSDGGREYYRKELAKEKKAIQAKLHEWRQGALV